MKTFSCAAAFFLIAACSASDETVSKEAEAAQTEVAATYDNTNPAWSPDGSMIAFYSDRDGDDEIFIADLDAGELRRITDNDVQDFGPAWSPDGQTLAFYRGGNALFEIYFLDMATGAARQITDYGAYSGNPAFSPDGTRIAFSSNKDGRQYEIYVMDLATGALTQLTENDVREYTPDWSPDGSQIAFASNRAGEKVWDIFVMNADGSDQRLLGGANDNDYYPVWSPDGKRIAFFSGPDFNSFDVYMLDAETGEATQITRGMGGGKSAWSPDGERIAFRADTPGGSRIFISSPDGENPELLTPQ